MAAQNNLQDLHKDAKKNNTKGTNTLFLFIQTNYQRTRNQPTFASAQIFDHKKKILTVNDSPLAEN